MKEIHLHQYKTGRLCRFAYYDDLRAVSCARALLEKAGWQNKPIKLLNQVGRYYLRSDMKKHAKFS